MKLPKTKKEFINAIDRNFWKITVKKEADYLNTIFTQHNDLNKVAKVEFLNKKFLISFDDAEYWIELKRLHEFDWRDHLKYKTWFTALHESILDKLYEMYPMNR